MPEPAVLDSWRVIRGWRGGDEWLLPALRQCFTWDGDRATGWLYLPAGPPPTPWPAPFAALGPLLLGDLAGELGVEFCAVAFQAYRDGSGCDWHHDRQWDAQAILSLGVTRTFGLRGPTGDEYTGLRHGDLLYMPPGFQDEWEHCVPAEPVRGERCSLVFRSAI
jgi:alkylated DNA repair dioxygenase AlkB